MGRIVKPHGIRGEVIVDLTSNRPDLRLAPGSVLSSPGGELEVRAATPHQGRWIVAFAGVGDRNQAELLRATVLSAAALDDDGDTLWIHQLIGAEVFDLGGRSYGRVEAVEANPASDLLVLSDDRLVPLVFVKTRLPGRLVIDPPPGLLD